MSPFTSILFGPVKYTETTTPALAPSNSYYVTQTDLANARKVLLAKFYDKHAEQIVNFDDKHAKQY